MLPAFEAPLSAGRPLAWSGLMSTPVGERVLFSQALGAITASNTPRTSVLQDRRITPTFERPDPPPVGTRQVSVVNLGHAARRLHSIDAHAAGNAEPRP